MIYECKECKYITNKKCDYIRHQNNKKHLVNTGQKIISQPQENNSQTIENNMSGEKNNSHSEKNNSLEENEILGKACPICAKIYKTKKCLEAHLEKCKGLNKLTCPRCMTTFKHQSSKSKHMKLGKCKPKSIFGFSKWQDTDLGLNIENLNSSTVTNSYNTHNVHNTYNIINNNTNNIMNANILINDYGKERMDYFTHDFMLECFAKCDNSMLPSFISHKHFNPNYPENMNVMLMNNFYVMKVNGIWHNINGDVLVAKLFRDNKYIFGDYLIDNKDMIENHIKNEDLFQKICELTHWPSIDGTKIHKDMEKRIRADIIHNRKRTDNKTSIIMPKT